MSAVQEVMDRAEDELADCPGVETIFRFLPAGGWLGGGIASAKKTRRKRKVKRTKGRVQAQLNPMVCDEVNGLCLDCWAACSVALGYCCLNPFVCAGCYTVYELTCLPTCDSSKACCPVSCGSDKPSSCCCSGETCCAGKCCDKGESCCEGNCCADDEVCWPGGVCCKDGADFCAGECCPQNTFCKESICCRENEAPCFGECCPAGKTAASQDSAARPLSPAAMASAARASSIPAKAQSAVRSARSSAAGTAVLPVTSASRRKAVARVKSAARTNWCAARSAATN